MATQLLFANNAMARLAAGISNADTTITLDDASQFPEPGASEAFKLTLEDAIQGKVEVTLCTARTGNSLTVVRGQEGTVATNFDQPGDTLAQNRITAETLESFAQLSGVFSSGSYPEFLQVQQNGALEGAAPVVVQEDEPAAEERYMGLIWFRLSDNRSFVWNSDTSFWLQFTGDNSLTPPYLGAHPAAPNHRNDGTPLQAGDFYFDTTVNQLFFWSGEWVPASGAGSFDPTADYPITGNWDVNAVWDMDEVHVDVALSITSSGVLNWFDNAETAQGRMLLLGDNSVSLQMNGASGWQDAMVFGQDYKAVVPTTGMAMKHADDAGTVRVPRIFVQAAEPDAADVETGDLWKW